MKYREQQTRKMPKKQAKNSFWYFMLDWKTQQEAKGRIFPNGFRDVQADPEVSRLWTNMSSSQKLPFVNRSKQNKDCVKKEKLTTTGESIQEIRDEEQRESDFKLNMEAHIRYTLSTAKKNNALSSLKFVFLHMNWYYMRVPESGPEDFCPAEFAIAEFSVKDGVTDYYHEIIKTEIYSGYRLEATETSQKTHQLNWDLDFAQDNWRIIYKKFFAFLSSRKSGGQFPPIYTSQKILHVIPSLLRRMEDAVCKSIDQVLIYTVESLFGYMLRAVSDFPESNMVRIIAENHFNNEHFEYTENIECPYHKDLPDTSPFCSLSIVRQWGLTFCDTCCQPLKITMKPGIHCPETPEMLREARKLKNDSASFISSMVPSALSATGVSQKYRIQKSEKRRNDKRLQKDDSKFVIIDHSKLKDEEREEKPKPELLYEAVSPPTPPKSQRKPATASQTLFGTGSDVPLFDSTNYPSIGGRRTPIQKDQPHEPPTSIWKLRSRKNSDSD